MSIKNANPIHPNLIIISTSDKDYSPIEIVQHNLHHLDANIGIYFVFNLDLKMGHKVIIKDTHIQSTEFVLSYLVY